MGENIQEQTGDKPKDSHLIETISSFIAGVIVGVGADIVYPLPTDSQLEMILLNSVGMGLGGVAGGWIFKAGAKGCAKTGAAAYLGAVIGKGIYQLAKLYT